eukprot:Phypoly_transcript_07197.p1 GENE.Phypoly_transcript_07197~~Phypoly_transcript_07197.p1  ORF type:complete len:529 (-),score=84.15 Phypoly_transcript_07197:86-1588(-)
MSGIIVQSELEAFRAKIPPNENILAEWFVKTIRKSRLLHTIVGNQYLLICTDVALYMIKLTNKHSIHSHMRYGLLDFTNVQVGYLSQEGGDDALDECEVHNGLYAIRLYVGPKFYKTFKHPDDTMDEDVQKAFIQVIFSSLKASRRELYRTLPQSAPVAIPAKQPPSPAGTPPAHGGSLPSMKQDSFMVTLSGFLLPSDMEDPVEGVITITQKHFVFEPKVLSHEQDSLTIPLMEVVECSVLEDDEVPTYARGFTLKRKAKVLQIFADGKKLCFPVAAPHAESARARLAQWVQVAHDKLAQEVVSQSVIEHPLFSKDDTTTNFKGDSDILTVKDILYLQYKMPERHAMGEKWELVYSTTRHGISINTFYTKVHDRAPSIIVVEDTNHHIFGGYASEPWVKTKQVHYGSGESFLFKIKPVSKVFKWSKLNDYFLFSKPDFISFGSGGGGYGLWLDSDFEHGSSATSDTYLNEPLSNTEQFKVLKIEVWAPPVYFQKKLRPL